MIGSPVQFPKRTQCDQQEVNRKKIELASGLRIFTVHLIKNFKPSISLYLSREWESAKRFYQRWIAHWSILTVSVQQSWIIHISHFLKCTRFRLAIIIWSMRSKLICRSIGMGNKIMVSNEQNHIAFDPCSECGTVQQQIAYEIKRMANLRIKVKCMCVKREKCVRANEWMRPKPVINSF